MPGAVDLHFVVRDTGIGISPGQQGRIFEPFSQADSSTTRHYGGTGLGLGISKSLIELMSGRIWVESEPGEGSRFHFIVRLGLVSGVDQPVASVAIEKGAGQHARNAKPASILLVEDNAVNRKLAVTRLEQWGHNVSIAENGQQALDRLAQQGFDLILMDVQMPVMGGFEATAKIREREGQTGRRTPILAMTANAMSGDRERCLQAGMDGYVSKPIRAEEMFNSIEQALSGGIFTAEIVAQTGPGPAAEFDYSAALARADQEVLEIIGDLVLEDCPRLLSDLVKAVAEGDQELIKRSVHTLKGMLGNFGETPALKIAEKADMLASTGRLADLPSYLPEIEAEAAVFLEALARHIHKE
jgi:CheY-like chemotaxis protein